MLKTLVAQKNLDTFLNLLIYLERRRIVDLEKIDLEIFQLQPKMDCAI